MGKFPKPDFNGHKSSFIRDYCFVAGALIIAFLAIIVVSFFVIKKTAPPPKPRVKRSKHSKEKNSDADELENLDKTQAAQ